LDGHFIQLNEKIEELQAQMSSFIEANEKSVVKKIPAELKVYL